MGKPSWLRGSCWSWCGMSDVKCRCGAYAKDGLRHRTGRYACCSRCYDISWEGVSDNEWERQEFRSYDYDEVWHDTMAGET